MQICLTSEGQLVKEILEILLALITSTSVICSILFYLINDYTVSYWVKDIGHFFWLVVQLLLLPFIYWVITRTFTFRCGK